MQKSKTNIHLKNKTFNHSLLEFILQHNSRRQAWLLTFVYFFGYLNKYKRFTTLYLDSFGPKRHVQINVILLLIIQRSGTVRVESR